MPTKNEILLEFQKDLQELNASFEGELAKIERARIKKFGTMPSAKAAVAEFESASAAATAELGADRTRARNAREKAVALAVDERRGALKDAEKAWRKAEQEAERARDDARTKEDRKYQDKLEEISKILPLHKQTLLREAETDRHEKELSRIQQDFGTAWDRAREDYQSEQQDALDEELAATETANSAQHEAEKAADAEYDQSLDNAADKLHDTLLKLADTKQLEEDYQQQLRDTRQRWETEKTALRAQFNKDYHKA